MQNLDSTIKSIEEKASFALDLHPGNVKAAMEGMKSSDLWKVKREKIRVIPGFNIREDTQDYLDHIEGIAHSMSINGYMNDKPLAGYIAKDGGEDVVFVTDGHSRLRAFDLAVSRGAQMSEIPIVPSKKGTNMEDLTVALYNSASGRSLTTVEKAVLFKRLVGFGWEVKKIASEFRLSPGYVNDLLNLIASPASIRDLIKNGTISATLAIETIKDKGHAAAAEVLVEAAETAKASGKKVVTKKNLKKKPVPTGPKPKDLLSEIIKFVGNNPDAIAKNDNGSILAGWIEEAKQIA